MKLGVLFILSCLLSACSCLLHLNHLRAAALPGPVTVCGNPSRGKVCHCQKTMIDCNHAQLHTANLVVSQDTKNHKAPVTHLSMQYCTLSALFKGKILPGHEKTLTKLDFSYNFITFLQNKAFEGMNELAELDLSYNHIHHLERDMFHGLDYSLLSLSLRENYLRNLTGEIFKDLSSLKYLSLDDNPIRELHRDAFSGLGSLEELGMDNSQLTHVEKGWFPGLTRLETLSMRNAKFLTVPSFHGLSNLKSLDLSENPIISVTSHSFEGLHHLSRIHMKHMSELWSIEDCAFCGLRRLVEVVVYNCSMLTFVDPEAFGDPKYFDKPMEVVDFERNDLTMLSEWMLPWKNVSSIKLGENPWHCDCSTAWMSDKKLNYQDEPPTCYSPKRLEDKVVTLLHKDEICTPTRFRSLTIGRILITVTIVLLIAGTVTLAWYLWLTRWNGPKLRNVFYRPDLPKYAYRNLAMSSETDDTVFDAQETKKMTSNSRREFLPEPVAL